MNTFYVDNSTSTLNVDIYKPVHILKKLPLDIECIHAYDDFLIVGTKQGNLLMYKLSPKPNLEFDVHIIRSNKTFAKRPIVQLEALPEFHILISLSDNTISVSSLDPVNSSLICTVEKCKGATRFVTDIQRMKNLSGEQQSLLRICVIVKKRLMLFYWKNNKFNELAPELLVPDVPRAIAWSEDSLCVCIRNEYIQIKVTGEQKEITVVGKNEPLIAALDHDRLIALCIDEKSYVLDANMSPVLREPISWTDLPIAVVDDMPYLNALLPNSVVEVQTMEPRLSIQRVTELTQLSSSKMKQLVKCVNRKGRLFVASNNDVFCLIAVPISQQIPQLIREGQYKLALELANLDSDSANKEETGKMIEKLHAFDLFCKKKFKESTELFAKLNTDPAYVIGLYPDLLPDVYRSKIEYPRTPPSFEGGDLQSALDALVDYLIQVRHKVMNASSNAFIGDLTEPAAIASRRLKLQQIVETTLLKCYLHLNKMTLVESLLRLKDNQCHLEETEQVLKRHHKYNELIILYQIKGLHRKALDLLRKQSARTDSPSHLVGPERTIYYLQSLGAEHLDLIFEYAAWIITEYPEDGLRIFTEDVSETEQLPRDKVCEFLRKTNDELVMPYLEHIISNWNDTNPSFHNNLVHRYRERVRALLPQYLQSLASSGQRPASAGQEPGELGQYRRKLLSFLSSSDHYSTEIHSEYLFNDGLYDERAVVMGKIGNHDEALAIYVTMLDDPEKAEAYCCRVYDKNKPANKDVFLKLLQLYLRMAELSQQTTTEQGDVGGGRDRFGGAEVSRKDICERNVDAAIRLLSKHATKIDPLCALKLLPTWLPLPSVSAFLDQVTKHYVSERREGQIFRNLLLSQHQLVQVQRIQLQQSQKIVVDEHDVCHECQRRLGKSAFLRFPSNNHLVHYSCKEKYLENNGFVYN